MCYPCTIACDAGTVRAGRRLAGSGGIRAVPPAPCAAVAARAVTRCRAHGAICAWTRRTHGLGCALAAVCAPSITIAASRVQLQMSAWHPPPPPAREPSVCVRRGARCGGAPESTPSGRGSAPPNARRLSQRGAASPSAARLSESRPRRPAVGPECGRDTPLHHRARHVGAIHNALYIFQCH